MARHYTTKDFFRQIPNTLLARYFHERELFTELDFSAMKETKPDALFTVWLALNDEQRNPMDAVFREIFDMSCKKGFQSIIDEARWQLRETPEAVTPFVDTLSELPNHCHRALRYTSHRGSTGLQALAVQIRSDPLLSVHMYTKWRI